MGRGSAEFRDIHGADPSPFAFASAACRNALGHDPGPAHRQEWVDFLTEHGNGKPARAATALGIMDSMAPLDAPAGATAAHPEVPRAHLKKASLRGSPS